MKLEVVGEVVGPWSLETSRAFWEGFAPAALAHQDDSVLSTVFVAEGSWRPVEARVTQEGDSARITVSGDGDLEAAVEQVRRFLSLDIDATEWPDVAARDPVIADAQRRLPGLRPCGFHSPYEAAAWAVLSQRIRVMQAASLRADLTRELGEGGAFPSPIALLGADLDLPGRKLEYLHSVAEATLDGRLDAARLRSLEPDEVMRQVREIKGLGPFAAELVVIRGANAPDAFPQNEGRLAAEIAERYGADRDPLEISDAWRPFRSWASVHLRALREYRLHEMG